MKGENQMLQMNDEFKESETAQYVKSYMFIKGFAVGKDLKQTRMALDRKSVV